MPTTTAQTGTIDQQLNTAAAVFERAFFPGREPRSDAYKAGVYEALRRRLEGVSFPPLQWPAGSAERDAYFAGIDEGNTLANSVTCA